jgi:hypothetical protein
MTDYITSHTCRPFSLRGDLTKKCLCSWIWWIHVLWPPVLKLAQGITPLVLWRNTGWVTVTSKFFVVLLSFYAYSNLLFPVTLESVPSPLKLYFIDANIEHCVVWGGQVTENPPKFGQYVVKCFRTEIVIWRIWHNFCSLSVLGSLELKKKFIDLLHCSSVVRITVCFYNIIFFCVLR